MLIWLYSFLVQSTLFLSLAWLLVKLVPQLSLRSREIAWNTAILASLVGPTLHVMWPDALPTPWQMPAQLTVEAPTPAIQPATNLPAAILGSSDGLDGLLHPGNLPPLPAALAITPVVESPDVVTDAEGQSFWILGLTRLWVIGACLSLLAFAWRYQRLRHLLADREPVLDGNVRLILDRLRLAAKLPRPIHLTHSGQLGSPVAIGVGRNAEICLPSRALQGMPKEQIHAMLGHEVAHHMRRDPVHLLLLNLLQSLFFFQPLLRVARVDLHHIAEQQCDAWGAHQAGDRWSMARCLAEVATWLLPRDATHLAAGMARKRSQLTTRVRSLMDEDHNADAIAGQINARKPLLAASAALIAAPFLAPQVISSPAVDVDAEDVQEAQAENVGESLEQEAVPAQRVPKLPEGSRGAEFLQYWDLYLLDVQTQIAEIRYDLGPFADLPKYKPAIDGLENHLHALMRMRTVLEHLLILLDSEDGPSSEQAANQPNPTRN